MLKIKDLKAGVENNLILKGINLEVKAGEVHAIMGPNGSGKSTLSSIIAGKEEYKVEEGSISFEEEDLLELAPEERAHKGVFLSFQYPIEIPGISKLILLLILAISPGPFTIQPIIPIFTPFK